MKRLVIVGMLALLIIPSVALGTSPAALPTKAQIDANTRAFLKPVRDCAQIAKATLAVLNDAIRVDIVSSISGFASEDRAACQEDRDVALHISRAGYASAAQLGIRVFTITFSALRLLEDGVDYDSKAIILKARNQFVAGWAAYKRAWSALNAARARVGLGPLPMTVRP